MEMTNLSKGKHKNVRGQRAATIADIMVYISRKAKKRQLYSLKLLYRYHSTLERDGRSGKVLI
jgi:hypothetical protein